MEVEYYSYNFEISPKLNIRLNCTLESYIISDTPEWPKQNKKFQKHETVQFGNLTKAQFIDD